MSIERADECDRLIGRDHELRQLLISIEKRESRLVWGAADSGTTALLSTAISRLPRALRLRCATWTGAASGRELVSQLIAKVYLAGSEFLRKKVRADGERENQLEPWLKKQSALRLRGLLYSAVERGEYLIFLDHLAPATHHLAHFMKEIVYRCKTPIYLAARGCTQKEIGFAWSLFWTDELRIYLGPLSGASAIQLLDHCISKYELNKFDLTDFRKDVLRLSGHLPGSIVEMCRMAAEPQYHYGDEIKTKLVHVDYLMRAEAARSWHSPVVQ
ncbi:MAG: ATP-binding protein [Candidatus Acidiferrales bacterium]